MDFKTTTIEKMQDANLSQSSIKNYIRNLELLNDGKALTNYTFLKDKNKIMEIIGKKKPNTQRSYLISIVSFFKAIGVENKLEEFYYDKMMNINKTLKEDASKNEKTETQKKNWVTKTEIDEKLNGLVDKVKSYGKKITEKQYESVLQMIILSLYVLQPPRRNADYQYMIIMKDKPTNDKINFLLYGLQKFYFRKFKTAKTELKEKEEIIVDINDKLMENIKLYLKYHPLISGRKILNFKIEIPFLVNYSGEPLLAVNSITYVLNKIFGKNVGSSMLRHAYLTEKYGENLEEMKKDAEAMSHGLSQQKEYIKNVA